DTIASPSGGAKYRLVMSRTFSSNSGSLLSLKVRCRHGRSPLSRHSRETHGWETDTPSVCLMYLAICPAVQCEIPSSAGGVCRVSASTRPLIRSGIVLGPPGEDRETRPSSPCPAYLLIQRSIVGRDAPDIFTISAFR